MALATLRSETAQIVALADRDLARLWRLIAQGVSAGEALHDLLPAIVREYGSLGAALAAEWYDDQREKVGARGRFTSIPLQADDRGAHSLVGWALSEATTDATLQALILGGVQRRIADHVRYTIAASAVADPAARGWQRVGTGSTTCKFCQMINGRGAVFTETTADFGAHDNDDCQAVPAWKGKAVPARPYVVSPRRTLDPSTGKPIPDADFNRAKKWIDEHL